jgi:hypothetical protein
MEPAINNDLHNTVDLTKAHFVDIGWFPGSVATTLQEFVVEGREDGIFLRWRFADPTDVAAVVVERAGRVEGPWSMAGVQLEREGDVWSTLDTATEPGETVYYRLNVTDQAGEAVVMGLASGQRGLAATRRTFLSAPMPNPTIEGSLLSFGLERPEYVRLTVHDVKGRKVRTLHEGMMGEGHYTRHWDGLTDASSRASAGVYFINLHTSKGVQTQRVTVLR